MIFGFYVLDLDLGNQYSASQIAYYNRDVQQQWENGTTIDYRQSIYWLGLVKP